MNAPLRSKDLCAEPSRALPVEGGDSLIAEIMAAVPTLSLSAAQGLANVIRAYPNHWRDWRPERAWDRTYTHLLAYRAAIDEGAA